MTEDQSAPFVYSFSSVKNPVHKTFCEINIAYNCVNVCKIAVITSCIYLDRDFLSISKITKSCQGKTILSIDSFTYF